MCSLRLSIRLLLRKMSVRSISILQVITVLYPRENWIYNIRNVTVASMYIFLYESQMEQYTLFITEPDI